MAQTWTGGFWTLPVIMNVLILAAETDDLAGLVINLLRLIPLCTVLLILTVIAWYASRLIRVHLEQTELRPADYLESFQKLHEEGELTREEFRTIRRLVSLQMSRSPDKPKPDYALLNKSPPAPSADKSSGNIPKN